MNEEESNNIRCIAEAHQAYIKLNWEYIVSRECELPSLRLMINHDYSGIHPDWMKQTKHDLTTRDEAIEEEINF